MTNFASVLIRSIQVYAHLVILPLPEEFCRNVGTSSSKSQFLLLNELESPILLEIEWITFLAFYRVSSWLFKNKNDRYSWGQNPSRNKMYKHTKCFVACPFHNIDTQKIQVIFVFTRIKYRSVSRFEIVHQHPYTWHKLNLSKCETAILHPMMPKKRSNVFDLISS